MEVEGNACERNGANETEESMNSFIAESVEDTERVNGGGKRKLGKKFLVRCVFGNKFFFYIFVVFFFSVFVILRARRIYRLLWMVEYIR